MAKTTVTWHRSLNLNEEFTIPANEKRTNLSVQTFMNTGSRESCTVYLDSSQSGQIAGVATMNYNPRTELDKVTVGDLVERRFVVKCTARFGNPVTRPFTVIETISTGDDNHNG